MKFPEFDKINWYECVSFFNGLSVGIYNPKTLLQALYLALGKWHNSREEEVGLGACGLCYLINSNEHGGKVCPEICIKCIYPEKPKHAQTMFEVIKIEYIKEWKKRNEE